MDVGNRACADDVSGQGIQGWRGGYWDGLRYLRSSVVAGVACLIRSNDAGA